MLAGLEKSVPEFSALAMGSAEVGCGRLAADQPRRQPSLCATSMFQQVTLVGACMRVRSLRPVE